MRLLAGLTSKPQPVVSASPAPVKAKATGNGKVTAGNGQSRKSGKSVAPAESASESVAAPAPAVDYTRPTTSTELLLELQRRVIRLEELSTRKLTAGEFAIAIEAMTGMSVEQWQRAGTVVEKCLCSNVMCKGWRMTPVEHHRTAAKVAPRDVSAVRAEELKDVAAAPEKATEPVEPSLPEVFQQMFADGLLTKGKNDATLIPKDGPITWTHRQQLAFAHGFEMEELLTLEGKPRELQRRLIAALRDIGYNVIAAPEKS